MNILPLSLFFIGIKKDILYHASDDTWTFLQFIFTKSFQIFLWVFASASFFNFLIIEEEEDFNLLWYTVCLTSLLNIFKNFFDRVVSNISLCISLFAIVLLLKEMQTLLFNIWEEKPSLC